MSDMEYKILGKEKKNAAKIKGQEAFKAQAVWKISRKGCGIMLTNGVMVAQMLSAEGKTKALNGALTITDADCVYERVQ